MDVPVVAVPFPVAIVQTVTNQAAVSGGALVAQTSAPTPPVATGAPQVMVAT